MNSIPDNSVVLQSQVDGPPRWLLFQDPVHVVQAHRLDEVAPALAQVRRHVGTGLHAAGFVTYEAAPAFDPALRTRPAGALPLLWFGLYEAPRELDDLPAPEGKEPLRGEWQPSVTQDEYAAAIADIRRRIRDGDTYQVNYTFRLRNGFEGDAWKLFLQLQDAQRACYCAYLRLGQFRVCSLSPELFFSMSGREITCRPMKGTARRSPIAGRDAAQAEWLHRSEKNRAENVMIVDMIRNDLGMLAEVGTVRVDKLFEIERYPTVHQMTSTVVARTDAGALDVLEKMFPCASITGAPKVGTMEIIDELETAPRGLYTGAIGHVDPGGAAQFSVAIRTVVIDTRAGSAEYGVGGGITWDSDALDEYEECQAKAAVLMRDPFRFDLFETLLWQPRQGFYLLDHHLARLAESADYFDIGFDPAEARRALQALGLEAGDAAAHDAFGDDPGRGIGSRRSGVRLTLTRDGTLAAATFELRSILGQRVRLAADAIEAPAHIAHKTTDRRVYDQGRAAAPDLADVIFWTADGLVTESSIANVVARIDGALVTPPLEHGLLPGVFRRHLLEDGVVREAALSTQALREADQVFLVNSVRGWMALEKEDDAPTWRIASEFSYAAPDAVAGRSGTPA